MSAPIMRLLLATVVITLFGTTEAYGQEPPPAPTPTPHVGGRVFGVACPDPLILGHGETGELGLTDTMGQGRVTMFQVGTVAGSADDADASEITVVQRPAPAESGWSPLPGVIPVSSTAVDGPPRTVTYYLNILLGGRVGEDVIVGGNLWCEVRVEHTLPLPPTIAVCLSARITVSLPPTPDQTQLGETAGWPFFSEPDVSCLIRVLQAMPRAADDYWIFAAGLTDVEVIVSTAPPPTAAATLPPQAAQPELRANSPVNSGEQVFVEGSGFPPGAARKVILDPTGNTVYDIPITIGEDGTLHANFYIPGSPGTWRIVVYTSMGVIETTFEVIS